MAEEVESRIIHQANELFLRFGVRSITMDDIARNLGMSKKTLYQYFRNKAEIVYRMAQDHFREQKIQSEAISEEANNAIDQEFRMLLWSMQVFRRLKPHLIHEVQKYYPRAWKVFDAFKSEYVLAKVRENLERGVAEGLYRADMDLDLVARIRLAQVDASIDQAHFPAEDYDYSYLQMTFIDLYLRGIVTEQGLHLLHQYLKQIDFKTLSPSNS